MRPEGGKALIAQERGVLGDGRRLLGLPGNPASAFVCAELFLKPLLTKFQGAASTFSLASARLIKPLPANGPRTDYLRAATIDGRVHVAAIQDSSMLMTLARSTCLVVRAPHAPAARAGDSAEILMIA